MKQSKIIVAGIGPGNEQDITPAVITALQEADAVVGYKYYFRFVTSRYGMYRYGDEAGTRPRRTGF